MVKPNICVDFDGVLNNYHGYKENELYTPRKGAREFLESLSENYNVLIHTTRDTSQVREWLIRYGLPFDMVTNVKYPAVAYIDDRAVPFKGEYAPVIKKVQEFKTYWEE